MACMRARGSASFASGDARCVCLFVCVLFGVLEVDVKVREGWELHAMFGVAAGTEDTIECNGGACLHAVRVRFCVYVA